MRTSRETEMVYEETNMVEIVGSSQRPVVYGDQKRTFTVTRQDPNTKRSTVPSDDRGLLDSVGSRKRRMK